VRGGKEEKGRGKRDLSTLFGRGAGSYFAFSLFLLPFLLASLSACGHAKKEDAGGKKGTKDEAPQSVDFGAGDTTVFTSIDPSAPISFTVVWKQGGVTAAKTGGLDIGHLIDVTGDLYSKGTKSSNYRADRGDAIRASKRLTLTGDVVLLSSDGTKSLKAPKAQYRGDVGLVRAMGGVTAEGPFGTLSGVPELWATPDLSLIGTPDMVSQKLHIPALIALAATAAPASPVIQKGLDYKIEASSKLIETVKGSKDYLVTLKPRAGQAVTVTLLSRNMVFKSAGVVVILVDGKTEEVKTLNSKGAAEVVQTKPGKKVTLTGTGVDYRTKTGGPTGDLELGGRVTITSVSDDKDDAGKPLSRTVVAKGDHATAELFSKPSTGVDPLKSVMLVENVTIDVTGTSGHFTGEGEKLVYTPNATGARAVMTGKLKFGGDSPGYLGNIEGADIGTINLTKEGWQDILLEDSGGKPVNTTIGSKTPPKAEKAPPAKKKKKGEPN